MKKISLFSFLAAALLCVGQNAMAAYTPTNSVDTIMLTKTNIEASNDLSTSTTDYATGKNYGKDAFGVESADYYNMSKTERYITVQLAGVESFCVSVYNTNANRNYTIQVGDATAQTITHNGNKLETTAPIATNTTGEVSIKIAGTNASVYPVAIIVTKAATGPVDPVCPSDLTITGTAEVYAGERMTLTAALGAGNGDITYQWYKDGTDAANAIAGATAKTYTIESFSAENAGSYYCQASKEGCDAAINADAFVVALKEIKNITCTTDKFTADAETVVEGRMTISTPSIKLTFSNDTWNVVADTEAPEGYSVTIGGNTNPTVGKDNVPTAGAFYTFEASKSATLNIVVKVNQNKSLFVVKGTTSIGYTLAGTAYEAGSTITEITRGILSFSIEPNTPYYVYCKGSKLMMYGFEIPSESGSETSFEQVAVSEKAVKVVRDGQLYILRDGKTYNAQGIVVE